MAEAGRIIESVRIWLDEDGGDLRRMRRGSGSMLNWNRRRDAGRSGNADGEECSSWGQSRDPRPTSPDVPAIANDSRPLNLIPYDPWIVPERGKAFRRRDTLKI